MPDANWHLRHLYSPRIEVKQSVMPPYRFLFEKRPVGKAPSSEALKGVAVEPGYEVIPTEKAISLAAYLVSLRAGEPLFVAPLTVAVPVTENATNAVSTNTPSAQPGAPGGSATNVPPK
jgi:cytochrome c oxidase cbb3-type subunit 2